MPNHIRRLLVCASSTAAVLLSAATALPSTAAASTAVPFQIQPASFGNPNGSFDVPPIHCATVIDEQPGTVTVTGSMPGRWGCLIYAEVLWLNLATGASGSARLSDGLNGFPPEATLHTGTGQVALTLIALPGGVVTPGAATVFVP